MAQRRLIYNNWLAETGVTGPFGPASTGSGQSPCYCSSEQARGRGRIQDVVRQAVESLPPNSRELIVRYYFMGQSLRHISEATGRREPKLVALQRRALRMLKRRLAPVLAEIYNIPPDVAGTCPVCSSPHLAEVNLLIENRDRGATWKPVIDVLRREYGIEIRSPQVLIGHEKYHII